MEGINWKKFNRAHEKWLEPPDESGMFEMHFTRTQYFSVTLKSDNMEKAELEARDLIEADELEADDSEIELVSIEEVYDIPDERDD